MTARSWLGWTIDITSPNSLRAMVWEGMKEGLPRCPVPAGGAVRAALEMRRARGQRSPQKGLTEVMRCSAKVVAYFKATGAGWQACVEAVLRE